MCCERKQCAYLVNKAGSEGSALPSLGLTVGMKCQIFRYDNDINFRMMTAAIVYFTLTVYRQGQVLSGHYILSFLQPSEGDDVIILIFKMRKLRMGKLSHFTSIELVTEQGRNATLIYLTPTFQHF